MIEYIKPKMYKGSNLTGQWELTYKLDGIRVFWTESGPVSRANKPLYNLPDMPVGTDAEVYLGNFDKTITALRTKIGTKVSEDCIYTLSPLDKRLRICTAQDPSEDYLKYMMQSVIKEGYEGLIIRQGDKWLKVKPEETLDLVVTDYIEGKGKHQGKLGALFTDKGKVGTGFTDAQREQLFSDDIIGKTIEVSCMEFTKDDKMRHPRFIRLREDK